MWGDGQRILKMKKLKANFDQDKPNLTFWLQLSSNRQMCFENIKTEQSMILMETCAFIVLVCPPHGLSKELNAPLG